MQQTDRRNAENLAEAVPGATPRALQRFLTAAPRAREPILAALQGDLGERLLVAGQVVDGPARVDEVGHRGLRVRGAAAAVL